VRGEGRDGTEKKWRQDGVAIPPSPHSPLPAGLLRRFRGQAAAVEDDDGPDARAQHDVHTVHAVVDVAE